MNFSKRLGIFTMTAFAAFTMAMAQAFADGTATPTPVVTPPPVLDTAGYIGLVLSLARVGGTFSVMGDNSLNKDLTRSDHLYLGGGGELMLHFARSETTANAGFLGGGFNLQVGGARSLDSSHPNPSVTADLNLDLELGKPRVAPGGGPLPAPIMAKLAWNPYHRTPSTQEMGIPGGGLHATGELNGHWIYFDLIANPFTFSQNFALGTTGYQSTLDANLRAQLVNTKKVILSLDVGGKGGILYKDESNTQRMLETVSPVWKAGGGLDLAIMRAAHISVNASGFGKENETLIDRMGNPTPASTRGYEVFLNVGAGAGDSGAAK